MKRRNVDRRWTTFTKCSHYTDARGVRREIEDDRLVVRNSRYQVELRWYPDQRPFGPIIWLSIKRNDRRWIHDWRDIQRIKNELLGPEIEAVELYPAESRLVDTSNQYHLWAFPKGYKLPFGYADRRVIEHPERDPESSTARQRPWPADARPPDLMTAEEDRARPVRFLGITPPATGTPAPTAEEEKP